MNKKYIYECLLNIIDKENIKLDVTTIKLMEYILNNDILTCSKAKVSKYITYELEKVLKQYADCYELVAYTDSTYIFSIMVCEDKLVVMYEDQESNPKYDVVGY